MTSWQGHYEKCLVSAEEAVKYVNSGDRIAMGHACGYPQKLPAALAARAKNLENVEVIHRMAMGPVPYAEPGMEGRITHNSLFAGASTRQAIAEGRADYTPCFISEIPALFKGRLPLDVAMVTLSPPDGHGFCSLGVSVDYTMQAVQSARTVIAEINPNMPRTCGNSFVHVDEINYFVLSDLPVPVLEKSPIGAVEKEIGRYVASLVEDESTIQMGIGAIPDATLDSLKEKHDLGVHTEMFSDGVMELVEMGIINCRRKNLHPRKIIANFVMGSQKFYRWLDQNPLLEMHPEDYTNDPYVIAQNNNMVAVNSALQVDVMGQVAADTIGPYQFSGVGGQVDFIRGAARSKNGKSIIALPSTAAKGKISRITAVLDRGASVTTSRHDIDYVVTEYGIAELKGKTIRERMQALVSIAHPDFRNELCREIQSVYRKQ